MGETFEVLLRQRMPLNRQTVVDVSRRPGLFRPTPVAPLPVFLPLLAD
jgi:hypothetical protein